MPSFFAHAISALTEDMRMVLAAGIGTSLRQLVPRARQALPGLDLCLLGNLETLQRFEWTQQSGVTLVDCRAPIYSLREQVEIPFKIPSNTDLFWSPHYNIPLLFRGRLLVTVHDTFHLAMPQFVKGRHRQAYAWLMFRAIRRKACAIFVVSPFGKKQLMTFCPRGTQPVIVTPNGVDESWARFSKEPRPHEKPYLVFVGNLKPHKNLVRLLEAIESIQSRVPHDLIIVGSCLRNPFTPQSAAGPSKKLNKGNPWLPVISSPKSTASGTRCGPAVFPIPCPSSSN